jgi:hypothetical protein
MRGEEDCSRSDVCLRGSDVTRDEGQRVSDGTPAYYKKVVREREKEDEYIPSCGQKCTGIQLPPGDNDRNDPISVWTLHDQ